MNMDNVLQYVIVKRNKRIAYANQGIIPAKKTKIKK